MLSIHFRTASLKNLKNNALSISRRVKVTVFRSSYDLFHFTSDIILCMLFSYGICIANTIHIYIYTCITSAVSNINICTSLYSSLCFRFSAAGSLWQLLFQPLHSFEDRLTHRVTHSQIDWLTDWLTD